MLKTSKTPKILFAIGIQLVSFVILFVLVRYLPLIIDPPYSLLLLAGVMGVLASLLSYAVKLPKWWLGLQLFFPLLVYLAIQLAIHPLYYLLGFVLIWLVFSNAFANRVPLYLSNHKTRQALAKLVAGKDSVSFIDLGSGLGGNVVFMAEQVNTARSIGVETAPIPLLISKINCAINGGETLAQDIWKTPLNDFNLVYAFLSPEPMPELWQKVLAEMNQEATFVSNSFAVPDVVPTEIWQLTDKRKTRLYIYKMRFFSAIMTKMR